MTRPNWRTGTQSRYAQAASWHVKLGQFERHGVELSAQEVRQAEQFYSDVKNRAALTLVARVSLHVDRFRHTAFIDARDGDGDDDDSI